MSKNTPIIDTIRIRAMKPSDFSYIIKSWLRTYKYSGPAVIFMNADEYYDTYGPIVEKLLSRSDTYIAALREDDDVIVGFLSIERKPLMDLIHWVGVKKVWQKNGIGTYLLEAARPRSPTYFTHWTGPIQSIIAKYPDFIFNPFLTFTIGVDNGRVSNSPGIRVS